MRATLSGREFLSIVILFKKLLYIKEYEKKTTISICFSGNIQFHCIGQQQIPIKNVPSPEIAGLGEYGKVPVSLYTGVPDISVPIYELKAGNYSLSLAASYHLASVKPNSQSGCLGLGWNLIAGGYITRSVRGMYDEKCQSNGYAPGIMHMLLN